MASVKTFAAWSARAKEIGINSSRAAYQGYLNNIGASEPGAAPQSRPPATTNRSVSTALPDDPKPTNTVVDRSGKEYSPKVRGALFGNNPNKSYEGLGQITGGRMGGNAYDDRNNIRIFMSKTGRRGIVTSTGETAYETSPGSLRFNTVTGGEGGYITIDDLGAQKAEAEAAAAAAAAEAESRSNSSSGGGSSGGSSGGGSSSGGYTGTSSPKVDAEIEKVETAVSNADEQIQEVAKSPFPGAPASVQTPEDYRKWRKAQSAKSGWKSTIVTGPSGLDEDEYGKNIKKTVLTG